MTPAVAYVVYHRLRFPSGRTVRKYLGRGRRHGWTEVPAQAWFTTSLDDARRVAKQMDLHVEARELLHADAKFGAPQQAALGKALPYVC